MKARDVMVSPVITVSENDTVRDVARTLVEKHISAVPVLDEAGTERPLSWWLSLVSGDRAIAAEYVQSHAKYVKDVMTRDVQTALPETPLYEIADLLEERHIKRVPILNKDGDLVGIVSRANIVQAVASVGPALEIGLTDSMIRDRLLAELKKQSWSHVHKLNVTVTNGVVDLWGFTQSEKERQAIRVVAESIPGVTAVDDHLMREPAFLY